MQNLPERLGLFFCIESLGNTLIDFPGGRGFLSHKFVYPVSFFLFKSILGPSS